MKPKQKLKLLSISLILLMAACQIEDNPTFTTNTNKKVYYKSIESLFQDKNFKSSFEKIGIKNNNATSQIGRTIMEQEYDFTIIDQPASIVYTDSVTAYTLLIDEKVKETPKSISNLVIQTNNYTQVTKATILRYISNTPIINIDKFQGEMKYQPINYNPGSISPTGRLYYGCLDITVYTCINPETSTHTPLGDGCWAQPHIESVCGYYDDGSDNNTSGGGGIPAPGGGGTSSGGGGTSGGVTTSPVGNNYYYAPTPKNGGNYLNLSSPQISWLNAQSIILRQTILGFDPESNPETTLYASDVITFLMQNSQAVISINNYFTQNGVSIQSVNYINQFINFAI